MVTAAAVRRAASPRRAARYYTSGKLTSTKGADVSAILWLWLVLVVLAGVRRGSFQLGRNELALFFGLAGLSVAAGTVAPRVVQLFLVGLLIAGVLGAVPQVEAAIGQVQARIDQIYAKGTSR